MTAPAPEWIKLGWRMPGMAERVIEAVQNLLEDDGHGIVVAGAKTLYPPAKSDWIEYRLHDGSLLSVEYDYDGAPDATQRLTICSWSWSWKAGDAS